MILIVKAPIQATITAESRTVILSIEELRLALEACWDKRWVTVRHFGSYLANPRAQHGAPALLSKPV